MASSTLCATIIVALLVVQASSKVIDWTGDANNGIWETKENWYPSQVPGEADDVTINSGPNGPAVVTVTGSASVKSVKMGSDPHNTANLTIFNTFKVGTSMTVDANGYLLLSSGATALSGLVTVTGYLGFSAGSISGLMTVTAHGTADLDNPGQKALLGATLTVNSPMHMGGLIALNQSSQFIANANVTVSGLFIIQAQDTTPVLFDCSGGALTYAGPDTFIIQAPVKLGTFTLKGGNVTMIDDVTFVSTFEIPKGSTVQAVGVSVVNLTKGVTGGGILEAEGKKLYLGNAQLAGELIVGGGDVVLVAPVSVGTLSLSGGAGTFDYAIVASHVNIISGSMQGKSPVKATTGTINTPGYNLEGAISFSGTVTTAKASLLAFGKLGQFTLLATATLMVSKPGLLFTGPQGSPGVNNDGLIKATGPITFQNVNLGGLGSADVGDVLSLTNVKMNQHDVTLSQSASKFNGTASIITKIDAVKGDPKVDATIGDLSFTCTAECTDVTTTTTPNPVSFEFVIKGASKLKRFVRG